MVHRRGQGTPPIIFLLVIPSSYPCPQVDKLRRSIHHNLIHCLQSFLLMDTIKYVPPEARPDHAAIREVAPTRERPRDMIEDLHAEGLTTDSFEVAEASLAKLDGLLEFRHKLAGKDLATFHRLVESASIVDQLSGLTAEQRAKSFAWRAVRTEI